MNLNKVFLIGRLTQDPEARTTPTGQSVTTIRMATNRVWTDQASGQKKEATEYHQVIAWGRLGEIASQYLKKGAMTLIEGRLQTRSWTDNQTQQKRYMTEIIAENLQLGPRPAGQQVADIKKPAPQPDDEIPIIDESEVTAMGVEEEPKPVKESDLPF